MRLVCVHWHDSLINVIKDGIFCTRERGGDEYLAGFLERKFKMEWESFVQKKEVARRLQWLKRASAAGNTTATSMAEVDFGPKNAYFDKTSRIEKALRQRRLDDAIHLLKEMCLLEPLVVNGEELKRLVPLREILRVGEIARWDADRSTSVVRELCELWTRDVKIMVDAGFVDLPASPVAVYLMQNLPHSEPACKYFEELQQRHSLFRSAKKKDQVVLQKKVPSSVNNMSNVEETRRKNDQNHTEEKFFHLPLNINTPGAMGHTALMLACGLWSERSCKAADVAWLLEHGADPLMAFPGGVLDEFPTDVNAMDILKFRQQEAQKNKCEEDDGKEQDEDEGVENEIRNVGDTMRYAVVRTEAREYEEAIDILTRFSTV